MGMKEKSVISLLFLIGIIYINAVPVYAAYAEGPCTQNGYTKDVLNTEKQPSDDYGKSVMRGRSGLSEVSQEDINSWFNDAVFVGDSITQGLENLVKYKRKNGGQVLGNASFLAATSYSLSTAAGNFNSSRINLKYNGQSMDIADALRLINPEKIFIMIGVNDLPCYDIEGNLAVYSKLADKLKSACPNSYIVIESCTPITASGQKKGLTNTGMDSFNSGLRRIAHEKGCGFADISTPLKNAENALSPEYSSDKYVHLSNKGIEIWIDTLENYAKDQLL